MSPGSARGRCGPALPGRLYRRGGRRHVVSPAAAGAAIRPPPPERLATTAIPSRGPPQPSTASGFGRRLRFFFRSPDQGS